MKEIDREIRDTLREEDAAVDASSVQEITMFHGAMDLFRGRLRWLAIGFALALVGLAALAAFTVIRFFQATEVRGMLIWGIGFMLCVVAGIGLKVLSWVELSKNTLMREIKRLELQVACLASRVKVSDQDDSKTR